MYSCRECEEPLARSRDVGDVQWICPKCRARVLALASLERLATREFLDELQQQSAPGIARAGAACPACGRTMRELTLTVDALAIDLDLCAGCKLVRFDAGEFEQMPRKARYAAGDRDAARRALAVGQVVLEARREQHRSTIERDELSWPQRVLTWVGLPVDVDAEASGRPWLTFTLAATLIVAFLFQLQAGAPAWRAFAWIPAEPLRMGGLTLLTSFFLHVGWLHLIGNVYFLLAFGRGVEGRLGARRMLLLLAAAEVLGNVVHGCIDPRSEVPCVGASSGLSALILFYAASFPWNRFAVFLWLFIPRTLSVPAVVWAGCWFAWQLLQAFFQHYGGGSVSSAAHLGGAIAGIAGFLLWRRREPTRE